MLKAEGQICTYSTVPRWGAVQASGACASGSPGVWGVSMLATLRLNVPPLRKCYHETFEYTFCLNQVENEICFTKAACNDI